MIHIDIRQPLAHRISTVARNPKGLLSAALKDPGVLASVFVAVAAVVSGAMLEHRLQGREVRVAESLREANEQITKLSSVHKRAADLRREEDVLEKQVAAIRSLDPDRFAFVRVMDRVASELPENLWVDALVVDGYDASNGTVQFRVRGFSPSVESVSIYEKRIAHPEVAKDVKLTGSGSTQIGEVPVVRFELSGVGGSFTVPDAGYAQDAGPDSASAGSQP